MSYQYNPHRHVKIWLSKDPNIFLNLENRVRLVKMRDVNPDDKIHFIYDSSLLTDKAKSELQDFCKRYRITAKDVQQDIIPNCKTPNEKDLVDIYQLEIKALEHGGNLGAASDILRWLEPVYALGTYTDFDVVVNTKNFAQSITVEKPFLISLGSTQVINGYEQVQINNDTLAVVDQEHALYYISKIQKALIQGCVKHLQLNDSFIRKIAENHSEQLEKISPPLSRLHKSSLEYQDAIGLVNKSIGKNALELRKYIINVTSSNLEYSKEILESHSYLRDDVIIKTAAETIRMRLKEQLSWGNFIILSKAQYEKIRTLSLIESDKELVQQFRLRYRTNSLKNSVIYTTGPAALTYALFNNIYYSKKDIVEEISLFSFEKYQLNLCFFSENNIPLHSPRKTVHAKRDSAIGAFSDLSWLQEGQEAIKSREARIQETQQKLPHDFYQMRSKITDRIAKIEKDLQGCFGFYRNRARHAKIDALNKILKHFNTKSFDVKAFEIALADYRTEDVSAAIGKSQTKELIDELAHYAELAKHYMLTDENELLMIPEQSQSL